MQMFLSKQRGSHSTKMIMKLKKKEKIMHDKFGFLLIDGCCIYHNMHEGLSPYYINHTLVSELTVRQFLNLFNSSVCQTSVLIKHHTTNNKNTSFHKKTPQCRHRLSLLFTGFIKTTTTLFRLILTRNRSLHNLS